MNSTAEPIRNFDDPVASFRHISAQFPRGLAVVTSIHASGSPVGLTMRAICPVSQQPMRFMIGVGAKSRTLPSILSSQLFCINFLEQSQQALAERFATKLDDKFEGVPCQKLPSGLFRIEGALMSVECRVVHTYQCEDHVAIFGEATGGQIKTGLPLVSFNNKYVAITTFPE